jgi:hypothetical protein
MKWVALLAVLCLTGCGGGSTQQSSPTPSPNAAMQAGQWEIVATPSNSQPVYIEANLTVSDKGVGSTVPNTSLFQNGGPIGGLFSDCGNFQTSSSISNKIFSGFLDQASGFTEATFSGASVATNGQSVSGGSYSTSGSLCAFAPNQSSGTFTGYTVAPLNGSFSGTLILPVVFFVIFVLLYMVFHSVAESAVLIFPTLYALTGGLILQKLLGYNFHTYRALVLCGNDPLNFQEISLQRPQFNTYVPSSLCMRPKGRREGSVLKFLSRC